MFILKLFYLFKAAMEYIEKALELDPQQGEWHFLYGKCLGRIRRIDNFNEIPSQKELKALENAARMTKNASYIIFLAQAYRETSFRVFSIHRNDLEPLKEKLERMTERSAELYRYVCVLKHEYKQSLTHDNLMRTVYPLANMQVMLSSFYNLIVTFLL